jgi:hypothetical protein
MATFFVGQRVRIVGCETKEMRHFVGHEGRIISPCNVYPGNWDVSGAEHARCGTPCSWEEEHLEPIVSSGHRPCDTEFKRDLDRLLEGVAA